VRHEWAGRAIAVARPVALQPRSNRGAVPHPMSQPDASSPVVSVIVVSYNTRCLLARCLDSLDASAAPPAIEVLVVDNASADGSAEMVAAEYPEATLLEPGENLGFARANNLAAESARGEHLLLLNSPRPSAPSRGSSRSIPPPVSSPPDSPIPTVPTSRRRAPSPAR